MFVALLALVAFIVAAVLGVVRKDDVAASLGVGLALTVWLIHPLA